MTQSHFNKIEKELKHLRKEGVTIVALSKKFGISVNILYNFFSGRTKKIKL